MFGSRCPASVVLLASFLLAPSTPAVRASAKPHKPGTMHVLRAMSSPSSLSPSPARPSSVSRFAPVRKRLKSVLEEKNPRGAEELAFDSLVSPNESIRFVSNRLGHCQCITARPLRC
jgi:hypothetical protein